MAGEDECNDAARDMKSMARTSTGLRYDDRSHLIAQNRYTDVSLLVDTRVIDLRGEDDLPALKAYCQPAHAESNNCHSYSRGFEGEVLRQCQGEAEGATLVRAIRLQWQTVKDHQQTQPTSCSCRRTAALTAHLHTKRLSSSGSTLSPCAVNNAEDRDQLDMLSRIIPQQVCS